MNDAVFGSAGMTPDQRATAQRRAWIGFCAMMFGNFMAILDIQIVASSLNEIQAGLSASADELTWVQTSYLIAEIVAIPLSGFMSRLLSTRIYFVMSALGFALSSLACAFAWNIGSMVAFRALQGFLGAGMIPTTMGSIFVMFPPDKRVLPTVLVGMVTTCAPALGPTIGGYLTNALTWHWLFLINLVPGLIIPGIVWAYVRLDQPDWKLLRNIDFPGLLFMAMFLGGLEYSLDEGPRHDWLADEAVRNMALVASTGALAFFYRMFTAAHPIVDLRVYANRNFSVGAVIAFVVGLMLYGIVFMVPTFFGQVRGYNSLQIGHVMMFTGVAMFFSAPLVGKLSSKIDVRLLLAYGLCMVSLGTFLNSHLDAQADMWTFAIPQILRGHGFICCMIPMTGLALGTLAPHEVKNGSGLFNVMRNLGGAIGLAVINTELAQRRSFHWAHLSTAIDPTRAPVRAIINQGSTVLAPEMGGDSTTATVAMIGRLVARESAVMAFNDVFRAMSVVVAVTLLLILLVKKPPPMLGAAAAEAH
ncbi:MAG TPA: DHA2 family efflux MFS transporter permease subunit [Nevskiaceae bacterium]|nr:DHA2 family efflux MFS transporter permease subunit [Nevskiaceae bacterium]